MYTAIYLLYFFYCLYTSFKLFYLDEFASLYLVAGMEYAVLGTTSWGELINPDDILTLEYAADLEVTV